MNDDVVVEEVRSIDCCRASEKAIKLSYHKLVVIAGWDEDTIYYRWKVHPLMGLSFAVHIWGRPDVEGPIEQDLVIAVMKDQIDREWERLRDSYGSMHKSRLCNLARLLGLLEGSLDRMRAVVRQIGEADEHRDSAELEEIAAVAMLELVPDELERWADRLEKNVQNVRS